MLCPLVSVSISVLDRVRRTIITRRTIMIKPRWGGGGHNCMSWGKTAQERHYITSAGACIYAIIKVKLLQELHRFSRYMFEKFSIEGAYREGDITYMIYSISTINYIDIVTVIVGCGDIHRGAQHLVEDQE